MAAQSGVVVFQGRSGVKYTKQVYLDDTNAHTVLFDAGSGAASGVGDGFFIAPEDVLLHDIILAAAPAITRLQIVRDGVSTGDIVLAAVYLVSITFRPPLRTPFRRGSKVGIIQLT